MRTTDLDAASGFYSHVLGWSARRHGAGGAFFRPPAGTALTPLPMAELEALPERARSLGAPAHWLGLVAVPEMTTAVQRWTQAGFETRGPLRSSEHGAFQALRDPQGAAIGLCTSVAEPAKSVAWCQLHVPDADRAFSTYADRVGWRAGPVFDLGPPWGAYRTFCAEPSGPPLGAVLSNAGTPQVHAQWLFFFSVDDMSQALHRLRVAAGRLTFGPAALTDDRIVAVCEDAQGAAFALCAASTAQASLGS